MYCKIRHQNKIETHTKSSALYDCTQQIALSPMFLWQNAKGILVNSRLALESKCSNELNINSRTIRLLIFSGDDFSPQHQTAYRWVADCNPVFFFIRATSSNFLATITFLFRLLCANLCEKWRWLCVYHWWWFVLFWISFGWCLCVRVRYICCLNAIHPVGWGKKHTANLIEK